MELTHDESNDLARALLASRTVGQRHQFFNWIQWPLQALIPHEILLCGVADESGRLMHQWFSASRYFREEHFKSVCHDANGLLAQMLHEWCDGCRPRLIDADNHSAPEWTEKLERLELKNVAMHAESHVYGQIRGYAIFSRIRRPLDAKLELYLEIILPQLLSVLARVLANEVANNVNKERMPRRITAREAEVLLWVREGKTNAEIAQILGLSALTVKNHIRHCMRKLDVNTRVQAVTLAISLGLLKPHTMRVRMYLPGRTRGDD